MATDLQNFRDMLDRAEEPHSVQYVGTSHVLNKPNIAIVTQLHNHPYQVVVEFAPDGSFVMFDLEDKESENE